MVTSYTLYEGRRFFLTIFRVAIALRGILQTIIILVYRGVSRDSLIHSISCFHGILHNSLDLRTL